MTSKVAAHKYHILILLVSLAGLFFRLWHIEFGLPHSFYADEPEIAELAIKYTYEIRDIITNSNYYKLIPISYVYGTLPSYLFTISVMLFSKTLNVLSIPFDKTSLYIFMRSLNAVLTFAIIPVTAYLYYLLFKDRQGALLTFFLTALNWKLIVHAHYINADIILTILLMLSYLTTCLYATSNKPSLYTWLTGLFFGLAIGTKVTAGLALPLYLYVFITKKDYRGAFALLFISFAAFIISNPFSLIFASDFAYRIYQMVFKEGGMVFDSVDYSPFKYLSALTLMSTLPVILTGVIGIITAFKNKSNKVMNIFFVGNILLYLVFYSIQSRRVDRWLLPVLPIIFIYSSYGFIKLAENAKTRINKYFLSFLSFVSILYYLSFAGILIFQFKENTPKSEAYLWMRDNTPITANKLIYTEEGLDPMNKLPGARVIRYEVYSTQNAQFFVPENPIGYDYIILSSRPLQNYKKEPVKETYPFYYEKWSAFEKTVNDESKFKLIKKFELVKPNLIPLSNVHIYQRVDYNPVN